MEKMEKEIRKEYKIWSPMAEAFRIALIYGLFGVLWISFSDRILLFFVDDFHTYSHIQSYKGWFYVFLTVILLYSLLYRRGLINLEAFEKLAHMAYNDVLTGLPNKAYMMKRLEDLIARKIGFYFVFIDLDNFRFINDTLGYKTGDKYLCYIADMLRKEEKNNEFVARLGGDEFGILFSDLEDKEDFEKRIQEIIQSLGKFWKADNHQFFISSTLGVVSFPENSCDAPEIYKRANIAMNKGKKSGKNQIVYYEEVQKENVTNNVLMANKLQEAIEDDELMLFYQSSFDLATGQITGLEVLLRLKDKKGDFVPPDIFIPLAEETGQIYYLDRWVFREALTKKKLLEEKGIDLMISINLSSKTLMGEVNFPGFLEIFRNFDLDYSKVVIEITETAIISDVSLAIERINELKKIGLRVALDDFGTGFSSLNHLKNLPIDSVKLDRSFIGCINGDNKEGLIIKSIINLGKSLGFDVIAEGIENDEQLLYLKDNGCPFGQGYLLHRPEPLPNIFDKLS